LILVAAGALALAGCSWAPDQRAARRIDQLLAAADLRAATAALEEAVAQWPQSAALRRRQVFILLKAEQPDRALAAARTLPADDPTLTLALRHADPTIRGSAARLIAEHRTGVPSRVLIRALSDSAPPVRRYCARELGRRGEPAALRGLFQLLRDDNWQVRAEAVAALARLGNPRAAGWLLYLLGDGDDFVRYQVEQALVTLAAESNRSLLKKFLPRLPAPQRLAVAAALATLKDPTGLELLREAAASEVAARRERAAELIGRARLQAVANELTRLREDSDPRVRAQAKRAMEMMTNSAAQGPAVEPGS